MISSLGQGEERGGTGAPKAPGPPDFLEGVSPAWSILQGDLDLGAPVVMAILNLTPDSFSDGGDLATTEAALRAARAAKEDGAVILDVGGESTRPGADPVSTEEELKRVLPFIRMATSKGLGPISIDTRNARVAEKALRAGAGIVNDVSGLKHDPGMATVVAAGGAGVVLSHMRGTPATMRSLATYGDVAAEVREELEQSLGLALDAGIPREKIVVDPGIGFAKTGAQSLALLKGLGSLGALKCPILVGPSRKSFLGEIAGVPPVERLPGTIAACVLAYHNGAKIFRVHDVAPIVQALGVAQAILDA